MFNYKDRTSSKNACSPCGFVCGFGAKWKSRARGATDRAPSAVEKLSSNSLDGQTLRPNVTFPNRLLQSGGIIK